jgi:hypothetical protein
VVSFLYDFGVVSICLNFSRILLADPTSGNSRRLFQKRDRLEIY